MITEFKEHGGIHSGWVKTSSLEGNGYHSEFVRKSDVLESQGGNAQVVYISCSGRGKENVVLHNGFGQASLRKVFDNYNIDKGFKLSVNLLMDSEPKRGKSRSGDMVATILVNENSKNSKFFTVFTVLIDNLTPGVGSKFGLWGEAADSYSASSQRECLHNNTGNWIDLARFIRGNELPSFDFEALNKKSDSIPADVMNFRNLFLANLCSSLPDSPDGSPLMRGIYALSATTITMSPKGFDGKSVAIRSKADIEVNINNSLDLSQDNHLPAQVVGERLGAKTADLYTAKLMSRIYDTTSPSYQREVGSFEMHSSNLTNERGDLIAIGIYLQSDGAKVGRDKDDYSSCGVWIEGDCY